MRVNVEYTDTFCGEANYSWVKRASFDADEDASDLAIVRKAKAEISLSGMPCNRDDFGDMIELRPQGYCTVAFISFDY